MTITISVTTITNMSIMFKFFEEDSIEIDLQSMKKKAMRMRPAPEMFLGEIMIKEVVAKEVVLSRNKNTKAII